MLPYAVRVAPTSVGLVIFDCDGVLVDSEPLAVRVDVEVLAELGWDLSEAEIVDRFVGRSREFMTSEIEAHLGRRLPDSWGQEVEPRYREAFDAELVPVDGVIEALHALTPPMCVASSSSPDEVRYKLRMARLHSRFEGRIFSAAEVANGKPAPDLFLHAAARMGTEPAACAVVEDSQWGLAAGRAAGMRVFAYAGGITPAQALQGSGTVVFDDMRDLPRLIEGRPAVGARCCAGSSDGVAPLRWTRAL